MTEVKCEGSHYFGCPCHEAKRDAEIERLHAALKVTVEALEKLSEGRWNTDGGNRTPRAFARESLAQARKLGGVG